MIPIEPWAQKSDLPSARLVIGCAAVAATAKDARAKAASAFDAGPARQPFADFGTTRFWVVDRPILPRQAGYRCRSREKIGEMK